MTDDVAPWQQGTAAAARQDWPAAVRAFRAHVDARPDDAAGWIALAKAEGLAGHPRAEHAAALRALDAGPMSFAHGLGLARLLRGQHEVPALQALSHRLGPQAREAPVQALVDLADLLVQADAHAEALPWLEAALARAPAHPPAWYLRGTTRLFLGEFDAAREDLARAIALAPHFAHAHWRLTELRAHDRAGAPARVERLRVARAQVAPGSEHDIHFSYALHAELHDLGRHDEAWAALERGAAAKRAKLRYDVTEDERLLAAIADAADAGFLGGPGHAGDDAPVPVFIVGLFRSGTTVLERLLAAHPDVADGGESRGFSASLRRATDHRSRDLLDAGQLQRATAIDFAALGADFMARSSWRARGRAAWTEKLPSNLLNVGLIARALPRARFLHVTRPAVDTCFSNLRMLYGPICRYSYTQDEMARYFLAARRLAAHWQARLGGRWLEVSHAALLADPEASLARVLAHLGLAPAPGLAARMGPGGAVSTASAAQVRDGLRAPSAPDWHPYRHSLSPLFETLGPAADA